MNTQFNLKGDSSHRTAFVEKYLSARSEIDEAIYFDVDISEIDNENIRTVYRIRNGDSTMLISFLKHYDPRLHEAHGVPYSFLTHNIQTTVIITKDDDAVLDDIYAQVLKILEPEIDSP